MDANTWSFILTAVGVAGFILAGRKIWWAWYVNIACQALWVAYALGTHQYGFLISAAVYTVVFTMNARNWTCDRAKKEIPRVPAFGAEAVDPLRAKMGLPPLYDKAYFERTNMLLVDRFSKDFEDSAILKKYLDELNVHRANDGLPPLTIDDIIVKRIKDTPYTGPIKGSKIDYAEFDGEVVIDKLKRMPHGNAS